MEGIELPSALPLLLRANLSGFHEWPLEGCFKLRLAGDLATDVAYDPAKSGAQHAQLPAMAVELLCVGVASRHHRGLFGNAQIGLSQRQAMRPGQPVETLNRGGQKD